eukprot:2378931-Ditylum_brightwellii.AAC.1
MTISKEATPSSPSSGKGLKMPIIYQSKFSSRGLDASGAALWGITMGFGFFWDQHWNISFR